MNQQKNLNIESQNKQYQRRQSIQYNIFHQLDDNNLVRKPLEEQKNSLMEAISTAIYYTPIYGDKILQQCKTLLIQLDEQNNLPVKFNRFIKSPNLLQEYISNPSQKCFENTNLELVSMIYELKIMIYYISEDFQLHAQLINNKYEKSISLFKTGISHYDLIFTKQEFQAVEVSQQILSEIVLEKFQINLNKRSESGYFNWGDQDSQYSGRLHSNSIVSQDENFPKNNLQKRHKKSMSETNLVALEKTKNQSYNLFGQISNSPPVDIFQMFVGKNSSDNLSPLKNDLVTNPKNKNSQKKEDNEQTQQQQSDKKSDDIDENVKKINQQLDSEFMDNKEYQQLLNKHKQELDNFKKRQENIRKNSEFQEKIVSQSSLEEDSRDFFDTEKLENKRIQEQQQQNSQILQQTQPITMQKQQRPSMNDDNSSVDALARATVDRLESSENPSIQKTTGSTVDLNSLQFGNNPSQQYQNRYKIKGYLGQPQFKSDNNLFDLKPIENEPKPNPNQNSFLNNNNQLSFQQPQSLHNLDDFSTFQNSNQPPFLFSAHSQQPNTSNNNQQQQQKSINLVQQQLQNVNLNSASNLHTQESTNSSFINHDPQQKQPPFLQNQFLPTLQQPNQQFSNKSPFRGNSPMKPSNLPPLQSQSSNTENNGQISSQRYTGRLKFFDENKNYGFLICEHDNSDIFVHYDDLEKANITKQFLKQSKLGNIFRFSFSCLNYIGRHNRSRKAVDLEYLQNPNNLNNNNDYDFDNQQQQQIPQFQAGPFRQPNPMQIQPQQSDDGLANLGLNQPNQINFQFQNTPNLMQQPFTMDNNQQLQQQPLQQQQQQQQQQQDTQFYNYLQPNNQQFNPM